MSETHDYGEFKDAPGDNLMGAITQTAIAMKRQEAEVARLEEELKAAQVRLRHLAEHELPGLMDTANMRDFTLADGTKIEVREQLRGSIPKPREEEAFAWLEEHNSGNLIKREFVIDFDRDEEKWAEKFKRDLEQRKKKVRAVIKRRVHPQTLVAYLRERLESGVEVPLDVFGVFRQRVAKVKLERKP
jgi:hypothetical protein